MTRRLRRSLANPVQAAIIGASRPTQAEREQLLAQPREALANLTADPARAVERLATLVDHLNIAEALADLGICSDPASRRRIADAQALVPDALEWLRTDPLLPLPLGAQAAFSDALWLFGVQLRYASLTELERATKRVINRCRAALRDPNSNAVIVHEARP